MSALLATSGKKGYDQNVEPFKKMCLNMVNKSFDQGVEPYETMCLHLMDKSYDLIVEPFKAIYVMYEVYKQFFMRFLDMCLQFIKFVYTKVFELYSAMCPCSYFLMGVFKTICDLDIAWHLILMYFVAFGVGLRRSCGLHSVVILLFSLGNQGVEGRMICGAVSIASLVITHSCYFNRCVSHLSCGNSNGKTRVQNRRQCIENFRLNRKLFAVLVLGSLSTAHCMEQQQAMLQQAAALAQAATLQLRKRCPV